MILKICVDEECISYQIGDEYRPYAKNILQLIRNGQYTKAGLHIYTLMKKAKRL